MRFVSFLRGRYDWPSSPAWVSLPNSGLVLPLRVILNEAVLPCVWNAPSWRTTTGLAVSARFQYFEWTSSPIFSRRPPLWISWPALAMTVP